MSGAGSCASACADHSRARPRFNAAVRTPLRRIKKHPRRLLEAKDCRFEPGGDVGIRGSYLLAKKVR